MPFSTPNARYLPSVLLFFLATLLAAPSARAQDPAAASAPATPGQTGATSSASTPLTSEAEEEVAFDLLSSRFETLVLPPELNFPSVFVLDTKAAPVRVVKVRKTEVEAPVVPNADVVKRMFQAVRVSSISITPSRKVAVVSYQQASLRVHPGDTVLGAVTIKEIEKDRVLFQHSTMPPIWIYRVRPGMPPPEVVAQQ